MDSPQSYGVQAQDGLAIQRSQALPPPKTVRPLHSARLQQKQAASVAKEAELPSLSTVISTMQTSIASSAGYMASTDQHIESPRSAVSPRGDWTTEKLALQQRVDSLERALHSSQQEAVTARTALAAASAVDVSSSELLALELDMEKKYSAELESKLEEMKKTHAGVPTNNTTAQVATLQRQVDEIARELKKAQDSRNQTDALLRQEMEKSLEYQARIADLEVALEAEKAARRAAGVTQAAATQASVSVAVEIVTQQLQEKHRELDEARRQLAQLSEDYALAQREVEQERERAASLKKLWKEVVDQLTAENESLVKENADATAAAISAQETLAELKAQHEQEMRAAAEDRQRSMAAAQAELVELRKHHPKHVPITQQWRNSGSQDIISGVGAKSASFDIPQVSVPKVDFSVPGASTQGYYKPRRAPPPPSGTQSVSSLPIALSPGSTSSLLSSSFRSAAASEGRKPYSLSDALAGAEPPFMRAPAPSGGVSSSLLASYLTPSVYVDSSAAIAEVAHASVSRGQLIVRNDTATEVQGLRHAASLEEIPSITSTDPIAQDVQSLRARLAQDNAQIAMRLQMLRSAAEELSHRPSATAIN